MAKSRIKSLATSKTVWTGIASIIGAAAGFYTGTLPAAGAVQIAVNGLLAIFLRDAIKSDTSEPQIAGG